jgi:hypothetical protein
VLTVDRVAGATLALLALGVLFESRRLPLGSLSNPGPGWTPVVLALVLLGFGGALVALGGRSGPIAAVGWGEWKHAVAILLACAMSALLLERAGYRLTVTVVLLFLLLVVERKPLLVGVVFSAGLALATHFLFDTVLRVPLPRSPWGL